MRGELKPVEGPDHRSARSRRWASSPCGSTAPGSASARRINSARSAAAVREAERLAARRDQESAEKLEGIAVRAAEELAEQKLRGVCRRRATDSNRRLR